MFLMLKMKKQLAFWTKLMLIKWKPRKLDLSIMMNYSRGSNIRYQKREIVCTSTLYTYSMQKYVKPFNNSFGKRHVSVTVKVGVMD